ncbi:MAG: hypothetical protein WEB52_14405, partial [Dehalococcoidia bacterium]
RTRSDSHNEWTKDRGQVTTINPTPRLMMGSLINGNVSRMDARISPTVQFVNTLLLVSLCFVLLFMGCMRSGGVQQWDGGSGEVYWVDPPHCADTKPEFAKRFGLRQFVGVPGEPPVYLLVEKIGVLPDSARSTEYHRGDSFRLWRDQSVENLYITRHDGDEVLVFRYAPGGCM